MSRKATSQNETKSKTPALNKREQDSAAFRLSRVPQKFAANKIVKAETAESYAKSYYSNHPEGPDLRSPQEKLEEINQKLADLNQKPIPEEEEAVTEEETLSEAEKDKKNEEKFEILVKKKLFSGLVYGENSEEAFNTTIELAKFYNSIGCYASSLRNLQKAQETTSVDQMNEEDGLSFAIEYAEATLKMQPRTNKSLIDAEKFLLPFSESTNSDNLILFKRDLLIARLKSKRSKFSSSLPFYERAFTNFTAKTKENKGDLALEIAQVAEKLPPEPAESVEPLETVPNEQQDPPPEESNNDQPPPEPDKPQIHSKAIEYYQIAYQIYLDSGETQKALAIQVKLPPQLQPEEETVNETATEIDPDTVAEEETKTENKNLIENNDEVNNKEENEPTDAQNDQDLIEEEQKCNDPIKEADRENNNSTETEKQTQENGDEEESKKDNEGN